MSITDSPQSLFEQKSLAFERAAKKNGIVERFFRLAGRSVLLRFASRPLEELLCRAIAHVETERCDSPDLSIRIFETREDSPPSLPWKDADLNKIRQRSESVPRLYFNDGEYRFLSSHSGNLSSYKTSTGEGLFWISHHEELLLYDQAVPMRELLGWHFSGSDTGLLHAAMIGDENGVLLLTGRGGSGKSTTSLQCYKAGLGIGSDDCCAADCTEQPVAYSLFSSAKLFPSAIDLSGLSREDASFQLDTCPKGLFFLAEQADAKIVNQAPVLGIVSCSVSDDAHSSISHDRAASVLRALAPSSLFYGSIDMRETLAKIARLVRVTPGYRLNIARGSDDAPAILRELLS